ncbi:MAG: hypothetical protein RLZ73_598 [Bacteroidota bacterium]
MKKILIALLLTTSAMAQEFTPLYSHGIPNYKEVVNKQSAVKGADGIERISKVSVPTYRFFPAAMGKAPKACVVICPGGGYRIFFFYRPFQYLSSSSTFSTTNNHNTLTIA